MKRFKAILALGILVSASSVGLLMRPEMTHAHPQSNCGKWIIIPSPNPGMFNDLLGVAAISASDVWAVGRSLGSNGIDQTLTEHWNSTGWTVISSPNPGMDNALNSVAVISASDVWAVGDSVNGKNFTTLIEHWDGTGWTVVSSNDSGTNDILDGVAAISQNDVWAVGSSSGQTLTEHWNGKKWSIVPTPAGTGNALVGVAAISSDDVWAVGSGGGQTLTEHWDGTAWSIVPSLNVKGSVFNGVSSVPNSNNLWAVGSYPKGKNSIEKTLVGQWNGTRWNKVDSPSVSKRDTALTSITALSVSNAWAVGGSIDPKTFQAQTLIEHWNGSKWKIVSSPVVDGFLNSVIAVPASNILWAVGANFSGQTVTESYCSKK